MCHLKFKLVVIRRSILLVHGFTGHPERTWSRQQDGHDQHDQDDNDDERPSKFRRLLSFVSSPQRRVGIRKHIYWPRDLIPTVVPNARILTYGYVPWTRHSTGSTADERAFHDIVWNLLVSLEAARRVEPSRPLLFIAHSLGGIIIKEALRRSSDCKSSQSHLRSIYEFTSGTIFFGTPHGGADPRQMVLNVLDQVHRVEGLEIKEQIVNNFLPSLQQLKKIHGKFIEMAREKHWTIYCFQEQYGDKILNGKKARDLTIPIRDTNYFRLLKIQLLV